MQAVLNPDLRGKLMGVPGFAQAIAARETRGRIENQYRDYADAGKLTGQRRDAFFAIMANNHAGMRDEILGDRRFHGRLRAAIADVEAGGGVMEEAALMSTTTEGLPAQIATVITSYMDDNPTFDIFGLQAINGPSAHIWYLKPALGAETTVDSSTYAANTNLSPDGGSWIDNLSAHTEYADVNKIRRQTSLSKTLVEATEQTLGWEASIAEDQDFQYYFGRSIGDWLGGEVSHWLKRKTWRYCVGIMLANSTVQANNVNFDDDGYAGYDGQDFQADIEWGRKLLQAIDQAAKNAFPAIGAMPNKVVSSIDNLWRLISLSHQLRERSPLILDPNAGDLLSDNTRMGGYIGKLGRYDVYVTRDWPAQYSDKILVTHKGSNEFSASGIFYPYRLGYVSPVQVENNDATIGQFKMDRYGFAAVNAGSAATVTVV